MLNFLYILISHFIADFLLQTDQMAQNKSKSNYWLAVHVLYYGIGCIPLVLYYSYCRIMQPNDILAFLAINLILHFIVDYFTSRLNSKLWQAKEIHWFFVSIGFDQLLHYSCLFVTFEYFKI